MRAHWSHQRINALLDPACALLATGDYDSGEDVGHALLQLFPVRMELATAARDLHVDLLDADAPRITIGAVREARRSLCQILKLSCRGREVPNLRRRIRAFAVRLVAMNQAHPLLTVETQVALLEEAVGFATTMTEHTLDDVVERVRSTQVQPCLNQDVKRRVKKLTKNIKQQVDANVCSCKFVTHTCLVTAVGVSEATKLWTTSCFTLELYSDDGEGLPKAEAIQRWLGEGYSFTDCLKYFGRYKRCQPHSIRPVDAAWLAELKDTLFTQAATHLQKHREAGRERTPSPGFDRQGGA